jgi:hypothetical protein
MNLLNVYNRNSLQFYPFKKYEFKLATLQTKEQRT